MPLIGHKPQAAAFTEHWRSGRMPHAWLLAGPQGIGKRSFANAAAAFLLADAADPGSGGDGLTVASDHPTLRLIEAGSHIDLRIIERQRREKTGDLAAGISIDQVRELTPLLQSTPALSPWRVIIIDAIDDLARAPANALLKSLEEPAANTLFLLISHQPARLLSTIRSRVRLLRFQPLSSTDVDRVLAMNLPDATPEERTTLVRIAEGSPGRAMRFGGLDVATLQNAIDRLVAGDSGQRSGLARDLSAKAAQARYEAFLELVPARIVAEARRARGPALARALTLWEKARDLAAGAVPLALDPQSVVLELSGLLASLKSSRTDPRHG